MSLNVSQSLSTQAYTSHSQKYNTQKDLEFEVLIQHEKSSSSKPQDKKFAQNTSNMQILSEISQLEIDTSKPYRFFPSASSSQFANALQAQQAKVSYTDYKQAMINLKDIMQEIYNLVLQAEQEKDIEKSSLGFDIEAMLSDMQGAIDLEATLKDITNEANGFAGGDDSLASPLAKNIFNYFFVGSSTPSKIIGFFDFLADKISNLPTNEIMQNLAAVKGYWDNNSSSSLELENGVKVGYTISYDANKQDTITKVYASNHSALLQENFLMSVNLQNYNQLSHILLSLFDERTQNSKPSISIEKLLQEF